MYKLLWVWVINFWMETGSSPPIGYSMEGQRYRRRERSRCLEGGRNEDEEEDEEEEDDCLFKFQAEM